MANYRKKNQSSDPVVHFLDSLFKFLWFIISAPFRDSLSRGKQANHKIEFMAHWAKIDEQLQKNQLRDAIMSADILLDKGLQLHGISGTNLGERLKNATNKLDKEMLDAAWSAHKVRNRLAHELHYQPSEAEAKQALSNFRKVLQQLGLL